MSFHMGRYRKVNRVREKLYYLYRYVYLLEYVSRNKQKIVENMTEKILQKHLHLF